MKTTPKKARADVVNGLTVREYAIKHGCSLSPVRRAITEGRLIVDRGQRPLRIVGGEMPLTIARWRSEMRPAVAKLKPGLYGWGDDPVRLDVLCGAAVKTFRYDDDPRSLRMALAEIERIAEAGHGRQV